jgi:hypothetical protein
LSGLAWVSTPRICSSCLSIRQNCPPASMDSCWEHGFSSRADICCLGYEAVTSFRESQNMERKGVGTDRSKLHRVWRESSASRLTATMRSPSFLVLILFITDWNVKSSLKNPGFLKLARNHIPADFHFQDPPLWADWQTLSDGALCYSNVLGTQWRHTMEEANPTILVSKYHQYL